MSESKTITVERRGSVVLIGIDRASAQNRIDPSTFAQLGRAYFEFEQDEALRAAVLFGHGQVPAFIRLLKTEDFQERVQAVRERREPIYKGR